MLKFIRNVALVIAFGIAADGSVAMPMNYYQLYKHVTKASSIQPIDRSQCTSCHG